MGLVDITNQYDADWPDEWRQKIQDQCVGAQGGSYSLYDGCYCGLGQESALSNIGWMDIRRMHDAKKADPNISGSVDFTTNYSVSDFTFSIGKVSAAAGETYDAGSNAFLANVPSKDAQVYNVTPSFQRVSPTPIRNELQPSGSYPSYSLNWSPLSLFMFRDLIAVVKVSATSNIQETNSTDFTLEDYLTNRTISHPYITDVALEFRLNIPNSYTGDPAEYESWTPRYVGWPNQGTPWTTIYGPNGGSGNQYAAITHLNPTGIEQNSINWSFNMTTLNNTFSGNTRFRILGQLLTLGTAFGANKAQIYLNNTVQEGLAFRPFALTSKWNILVDTETTGNERLYLRAWREYDDSFEAEAMSQAACFGLFFMKRYPDAAQSLEDPDVYLGILENGIGHGRYTNDTAQKKRQHQWDGRSDGTNYSPGGGGGGGSFPDLPGNIQTPWNRTFNINDNFHCIYVISESDVRNMSNDLCEWTATLQPSDITELFKDITDFSYKNFLTNNPLECVVSLKKFPFEIPHSGIQSAVRLGNYTTAASGYAPNNLIHVFDQSLGFPILNQDKGACFLDYEPYTSAEILIPYAGMVSIPPSKFIGKNINVKYVCDLQTGQMTVYISADNVLFTSIKSNCAFEIAVTGLDKATLDSQYNNANVSAGQQALSIGSELVGIGKNGVSSLKNAMFGNAISGLSGITSTLADLASTALSAQSAAYDIEHIRIPFSQVGNASPICSGYGAQTAILYVYRPLITANLETFRQTHGFACCDVGTISSLGLTGYTEISQIDLSGFAATAAEKDMIKGLCASGIYL